MSSNGKIYDKMSLFAQGPQQGRCQGYSHTSGFNYPKTTELKMWFLTLLNHFAVASSPILALLAFVTRVLHNTYPSDIKMRPKGNKMCL